MITETGEAFFWRKVLTPRQYEALRAIKAHQAETGLPPTVRELAARLGNTLSSAHALLNHLERQGAISRIPGSPRSIRVLIEDDPPAGFFRCELDGQFYSEGTAYKHRVCTMIMDRKAAGLPL